MAPRRVSQPGCALVVVFFKQKTAYEIYYGLVGSEMCIRDRSTGRKSKVVDPIKGFVFKSPMI